MWSTNRTSTSMELSLNILDWPKGSEVLLNCRHWTQSNSASRNATRNSHAKGKQYIILSINARNSLMQRGIHKSTQNKMLLSLFGLKPISDWWPRQTISMPFHPSTALIRNIHFCLFLRKNGYLCQKKHDLSIHYVSKDHIIFPGTAC